MLSLGPGFLKLPIFSSVNIPTINDPAEGMIIYDTTVGKLRFFNGSQWQALSGVVTSLPVSGLNPESVAGFAVNQNFKHPSSVLEFGSVDGKAFQLPVARPQDIYEPVAGLLIYNSEQNAMMLYDGMKWNVLK
jgi:hypothetical protein